MCSADGRVPVALVDRYAHLLRVRAARVPMVMALLDALAIGMVTLSALLMVQQSTGSFATAGIVAGTFTLGNGLSAGIQGRLIDRLGPTRVLLPASVACALALSCLVALTQASAPDALLVGVAALGGLCFPQVVAAMRGIWTQLVDVRRRESAYAMLSLAFEVGVITGPLLVSAMLVLASPSAAVMVAALSAATAGIVFGSTGAARTFRRSRDGSTGLGALASPGVRTLALVSAAFGTGVAAARVGAPALAVDSASAGLAGVLLAVLSCGSLIGALAYGARAWAMSRGRRLAVIQGLLAAMLACCGFATWLPALGALLFVTGLLLAPFVITVSALVDDVIPHGMVTEAFAVTIMANIAGDALGTAVAGSLVDRGGPGAAFWFGAAVMAGGVVVGMLRRHQLEPAT
jgi:MFS family permease